MSSRNQVFEAAAQVVSAFHLDGQIIDHVLNDKQRRVINELADALKANASRAHTRARDPKTSRDAAPKSITAGQVRVMRAMRFGPYTDVELASQLRGIMSASGVRSRRAELVRRGLIVNTGATRLHNNRKHTIWALANTGKPV